MKMNKFGIISIVASIAAVALNVVASVCEGKSKE